MKKNFESCSNFKALEYSKNSSRPYSVHTFVCLCVFVRVLTHMHVCVFVLYVCIFVYMCVCCTLCLYCVYIVCIRGGSGRPRSVMSPRLHGILMMNKICQRMEC